VCGIGKQEIGLPQPVVNLRAGGAGGEKPWQFARASHIGHSALYMRADLQNNRPPISINDGD